MNKQRGFTLVELMIAVVIIGILLRIAIPAFSSYMSSGKLTDATTTLATTRTLLEQYYADNRSYSGYNRGICAAAPNNTTKYFSYSCTLTASTYTITATGQTGSGFPSLVMTIDQADTRTTTIPANLSSTGAIVTLSTCWPSSLKATSC